MGSCYFTDDDILMCCQEIEMDRRGEISFGMCHPSTATRTVKRMNEWLEDNYYDWRVERIKEVIDGRVFYGAKIGGKENG